jgi:hypothetical protein
MNAIAVESVEKDRIFDPAPYRQSEMEPGRDAWELLERVWMKGPHTIRLPVDPVAIAEDLEIEVLSDDELAPDVWSVLRKPPGLVSPQILLNAIDGLDRRRFPCALALGYYSSSVELGIDGAWEFVQERSLSAPRDDRAAYAFEFASELLMPRIVLRELDARGVAALAVYLGVTGDVMRNRLDRIERGTR